MLKKWFKKFVTEKEVDRKISEALGVKWLQSMQKLDVKDGDIVVIRHPGVLSVDAHRKYRDAIKEAIQKYGVDVHVMVFEEGAEIEVWEKQ